MDIYIDMPNRSTFVCYNTCARRTKMTLHEWLQTTYLSSECCLDLVTVCDNGSCYHQLKTNEFRFAKRFSEVTYKELQPYLDLVYESSYVYSAISDLIIVEVKVKAKE